MAEGKAPIWVRAAGVYREKGAGGVWFGTLSLIGYRRLLVLVRRLDEPVAPLAARIGAGFRQLGPGDEGAYAGLGTGDRATFRRRLALGHRCWGAWVEGSLRHFAWMATGETRVDYLRCRALLDDGVVYAYHAYTDPSVRSMGLSAARQSVCLASLRDEGFRLAVAAVLPDNPFALPPCLKVGYRPAGVVRALGTGPRPLVWSRVDAGRGGFRFTRERRGATSQSPSSAL